MCERINDDVERTPITTASGVLLTNMLLWVAGGWLARLDIHFKPTQPKPPNQGFGGGINNLFRILSS